MLEVGRAGKSDEEQLAYAVKHKMAILTHNIRDYIILSRYYAEQGKKHYGIIISEQVSFRELMKRTLKYLSSNTSDSISNRLIWLSDYK